MEFPAMTKRERENAALARKAAAQSMVLLKNEGGALPLSPQKIALFGAGAVRTVRGGTGSGDPFNGGVSGGGDVLINQNPRYHINILDALEEAGFQAVNKEPLLAYAKRYDRQLAKSAYNPMAVFAYPEFDPSKEEILAAAAEADTALYVLSRNTGEGHDRSMTFSITLDGQEYELGDYQLSPQEKKILSTLCEAFSKTILILNTGGPVDLSFAESLKNLPAILQMGQGGQEGGCALADILTGREIPSGKLTDSWAMEYTDYPASATFAMNDQDVQKERYEEGIYVGYRYFDSFGIAPRYEFGYGLGYTGFSYRCLSASLNGDRIELEAEVVNTGDTFSGREVLQVYCSAPQGKLEKPFQELACYQKTKLLAPGESQKLTLGFSMRDMASYDEKSSCFLLEKGEYHIRIGNSSRNTKPACMVILNRDIVVSLHCPELPLAEPLKEISAKGIQGFCPEEDYSVLPQFLLSPASIPCKDCRSPYRDEKVTSYTTDPQYRAQLPYEEVILMEKKKITLLDVAQGKATLHELVAQLSYEQLAALNCGTGWGVANDDAPIVGENSATIPGAAGESLALEEFGIPSMVMADGPGGVRVHQHFFATDLQTGKSVERFQLCTSWPVGSLLAQSFDDELLYEVGTGFARDMEEIGVSILLGPGMNIHRDPLCGRNFEYFSEDPRLTGKMAAAIIRGIQSHPGLGACLKHFAANNQETNRNSVDSIVGERAMREIYLRGFEIAVRESDPYSIMTAYNKINSVPAADSFSLCTNIARGEWGFEGLIMTDWNGGRSTPSISMHAGNDLIMPGGIGRIMNILLASKVVMPQFEENGAITLRKERTFVEIPTPAWNSFVPQKGGKDLVSASVRPGTEIRWEDGILTIDGQRQFTHTKMMFTPDGPKFQQEGFIREGMAVFDKDTITYYGELRSKPSICLGDLQRCAEHNLSVVLKSLAMARQSTAGQKE